MTVDWASIKISLQLSLLANQLTLVSTSGRVIVGVIIRNIKRYMYNLVKIKLTELEAEH